MDTAFHIARTQDFLSKTIREATKKYIGKEHDDSISALERIRTAKAVTQDACKRFKEEGLINNYIIKDVDEDKIDIVVAPITTPQCINITYSFEDDELRFQRYLENKSW